MLKFILMLLIFLPFISHGLAKSDDSFILADFRHRPPEMIVDGDKIRGPLKDILEEATEEIGHKVKWRIENFNRSLKELEEGTVDIVPKTFFRQSRTQFVHYLGPIFKRPQRINFLVRKGRENLINTYQDLYKFTIATKRSSFYFEEFNSDPKNQTVRVFRRL